MRIKTTDFDINKETGIDGLAGYDAVEILFRRGRDPVGRARLACKGDFLGADILQALIEKMPKPELLAIAEEKLPTVTVAVCTLNRPEELAAALLSLSRQEYPPDEILVVDNGCQNEVQRRVADILPGARYIPERRRGLNFARNRAIYEATGDVIAFMDDDAEAEPFWVQSLAESFAAFPQAVTVTGLVLPLVLETAAQQLFEENGGFARGFTRRMLPKDGRRLFGLRLPLIAEALSVGSGCNMAFKTTILKKLDGFDEALDAGSPLPGGGDLDIFYRVLRAGYHLVYEPRAQIRHRHRGSIAGLRRQLAGHFRSVSAFLVKTLGSERGFARITVVLFLAWRITKNGFRLICSLAGRDALPVTFNARNFTAGLAGLGSYHASKWRIRTKLDDQENSRCRDPA
jgi:glycosyltransferase involved in cell wall biosynthesis